MTNNGSFRNEALVFGAIGKDNAASYCQHLRPVAITPPKNTWEIPGKSAGHTHAWESYMDLTVPALENDFEVVGLLNEKTDNTTSNQIGVKLFDGESIENRMVRKGPTKSKRPDRKSGKKKKSMGWRGKTGCSETDRRKMESKITTQALRLTGQQQTIGALNETIRKQRSTMAVMQGALSDKSRELDRTHLTIQPAISPSNQAIKDALKVAKKREGEIMERLDGLERQILALSADGTQNQRRLNCLVRSIKATNNTENEKTAEKTEGNEKNPTKTKKSEIVTQAENHPSKDATLRRVFNLQTFLRKEKEERERAQKDLQAEKEHTKRLCEKLDEVEDAWKETSQVIEKSENEKELLAKAEYDIRMCEVDNARVTRELKIAREKAKLMDQENSDLRQKMKELEQQINQMKVGLGIDETKPPPPSPYNARVCTPDATAESPSSSKRTSCQNSSSRGTWKSLVCRHRELMTKLEEVEKTAIATRERWSSSGRNSRACSKGSSSKASASFQTHLIPGTSTPTPSSQQYAISDFRADRKTPISESPISKKSSSRTTHTTAAAKNTISDVRDDYVTSIDDRRRSSPPSVERSMGTIWDASCDVNLRESVNDTSTVKGRCPSRAESVTKKIPGLLAAQRQRYATGPTTTEISSGSDVERESNSSPRPPSEGMSAWMETRERQRAARRKSRDSSRGLNKRGGSILKLRKEYALSKEKESRGQLSKR